LKQLFSDPISHQYETYTNTISRISPCGIVYSVPIKDTTEFADRCGFPKGAEEKLGDMLVFKDVYYEDTA